MDLIVFTIRGESEEICTHIHMKRHTHKQNSRGKERQEGEENKEEKGGGKRDKKEKGKNEKKKRTGHEFRGGRGAWVLRRVGPHTNNARLSKDFQFFINCKRTNNANNATQYVKLGTKRRESSKRKYYKMYSGVPIQALFITIYIYVFTYIYMYIYVYICIYICV